MRYKEKLVTTASEIMELPPEQLEACCSSILRGDVKNAENAARDRRARHIWQFPKIGCYNVCTGLTQYSMAGVARDGKFRVAMISLKCF